MNFLNEIKEKLVYVIIILLEIFLVIILFMFNSSPKEDIDEEQMDSNINNSSQEILTYKVDIKGAVVNPGVYEMNSDSIINDVINEAGGLKKGANTSNINLAKKIENEMIIKIFTSNEINKMKKVSTDICINKTEIINECENSSIITTNTNDNTTSSKKEKEDEKIEDTQKQDNSNLLININTASKEELMTLNGIGESKADAIIEYRNKTPFNKIEDITNVSGIGEQAFAKIKDYITI